MKDILKDRITSRMQALGKNPSSVALEAGLGRSAVRDILSGKAKNPGFITISAIARALDCSSQYLMGDMEEVHAYEADDILISIDARTSEISGLLEAGVFRQVLSDTNDDPFAEHTFMSREQRKRFTRLEKIPFRSKRRFIGRDLYLYEMGDSSMDRIHIAKGDLLTAVLDPHSPQINLQPGMIVVASRGAAGIGAEELSARIVEPTKGGALLRCNSYSAVFPEIKLNKKLDQPNHYEVESGGYVRIEGVVVSVTRQYEM
jgi:transcriptional regulator with XRE-family HTH domain